jgi:hypothetical protein
MTARTFCVPPTAADMAVAVEVAGTLEAYYCRRGRWALLDPGEIDRARGSFNQLWDRSLQSGYAAEIAAVTFSARAAGLSGANRHHHRRHYFRAYPNTFSFPAVSPGPICRPLGPFSGYTPSSSVCGRAFVCGLRSSRRRPFASSPKPGALVCRERLLLPTTRLAPNALRLPHRAVEVAGIQDKSFARPIWDAV